MKNHKIIKYPTENKETRECLKCGFKKTIIESSPLTNNEREVKKDE